MREWLRDVQTRIGSALLLSLALAAGLANRDGRVFLAFALVTAAFLFLWILGFQRTWSALRRQRYLHLISFAGLIVGAGCYLWLSLWALRPDFLPQHLYYDFVANRRVTEQLVDPTLLQVEQWDVLGQQRETLFVHPTPSGSTALVYPVWIEPRTTLRADLAVAPEAWEAEGDGVTFSVYVEDEAGMYLLYSRYVDPKHHDLDRRWLPLQVDLSPYGGQLVRVILVTGSGPAGDRRHDWAGWGAPRLERPNRPWEMIRNGTAQD